MQKYKRLSKGDQVFLLIDTSLLLLLFMVVLYPLLFVIGSSFNEGISSGVSILPQKISLRGYRAVFTYKAVWTGYANSLLYTVTGTAVNLAITVAAAYPLSRRDFYGRGVITNLMAFTMYFGGGLIPTYLLVRDLRMIDTLWAMIIPGAMSVYNVIIMRTYFSSQIPGELLEASQIDGCGNLKFLWKIVLPLSTPILAVIVLYYAVGHWNSYFNAVIYLKTASKNPLQIALRNVLILNNVQSGMLENIALEDLEALSAMRETMKYALIIVSSTPLLILYPFVQKYFVKGVMVGAIKG